MGFAWLQLLDWAAGTPNVVQYNVIRLHDRFGSRAQIEALQLSCAALSDRLLSASSITGMKISGAVISDHALGCATISNQEMHPLG